MIQNALGQMILCQVVVVVTKGVVGAASWSECVSLSPYHMQLQGAGFRQTPCWLTQSAPIESN